MDDNKNNIAKKDDNVKSDDTYAQIVIKKTEQLRKAKVDTKEKMSDKQTVSGDKTKHYNINTYKGRNGKVLATKRYCVGVTKAQHGRKRAINTAPGVTEKQLLQRERDNR